MTTEPIDLVTEIMNGIATLAAGIPAVVSLTDSAVNILKTGAVTPEQKTAIRAQLDSVKAQIDAA